MSAKKRPAARKRKQIKSKRQKNPKKMNGSSTIILTLFFIIALLYLGQSVYSMITRTEIPSITVQMGSVDFPVIYEGVIIRNEKIYQSPIEGVVSFNYNDLERVRKNDTICAVWNQREYNDWLERELSKVDADMLNLQERRGNMSAIEQDVIAYNEKIKDYIDNKVFVGLSGGVANSYDLKDNISQSISVRNQISLSENRGSVQNLYGQRQIYESQINANARQITSSGSGILSYSIDGLEGVFTTDIMDELNESQIHTSSNSRRVSNENQIDVGDPLFKIVESNEWYISTYINIDLVYNWNEGTSRVIYVQSVSGYKELEASVHKINKYDKNAYVVFKLTKYLLDFINERNVNLKITDSEHTGYKIPNSAIVDKTFLKIPSGYVTRTDMDYVLKRTLDRDIMTPVTVQERHEDYCLISQNFNSLNLGDMIVSEDNNEYVVSEVENCKGVYVINNGYAMFRKIKLNDAIPEKSPYTILNPNENMGIKIFDRILSDTRNITEGQKVY